MALTAAQSAAGSGTKALLAEFDRNAKITLCEHS